LSIFADGSQSAVKLEFHQFWGPVLGGFRWMAYIWSFGFCVFSVVKPFSAVLGIIFMASFWVGFDGWQILSEAYNEHTF
jgi:hypothetical protein